jgi:hypothetical protein
MTRSLWMLPVLAAALAVVGCGSVAAGRGSQAGATASAAAGTPSASASASPGQPDGSASTPGRLSVTGALCSAPGSASQVVITRQTIGPVLPAGPGVAAYTRPAQPGPVVKDATQAQQLAKAVCALPAQPATTVNCPDLRPGGYRLTFTAAGRMLPEVFVQSSGCELVTGAGTVRTAAGHASFLQLLASMAGPVAAPGPVHVPGTPAA